MFNADLVNEKGVPVVLGLALAYGGIVQLLAGMWEFRNGNTFGAVAFIGGSILGGYFAAKLGLRKALLPLCAAFNLPYLAYLFLVWTQPESLVVTTSAIFVEMFGYGFGFVAVTLFMMQLMATGPYVKWRTRLRPAPR